MNGVTRLDGKGNYQATRRNHQLARAWAEQYRTSNHCRWSDECAYAIANRAAEFLVCPRTQRSSSFPLLRGVDVSDQPPPMHCFFSCQPFCFQALTYAVQPSLSWSAPFSRSFCFLFHHHLTHILFTSSLSVAKPSQPAFLQPV